MKRIFFLLIISVFCQQGLGQAFTLETVMTVESISEGDYGEIVLVDCQEGRWTVRNPNIRNLNVADAVRVELEIKGQKVVGCSILKKVKEYFDEETNLEALMRVDKNKEGQRALFDSDLNEWGLRLPRWAAVGSLVVVDLVIKDKSVIRWHPRANLGNIYLP
jgi:hypothetical protein